MLLLAKCKTKTLTKNNNLEAGIQGFIQPLVSNVLLTCSNRLRSGSGSRLVSILICHFCRVFVLHNLKLSVVVDCALHIRL